jgi:hypothetical protein
MARTAQQILAERRATIMEASREKDATARSLLQFHVRQLDAELRALGDAFDQHVAAGCPVAVPRCPRCQQPTHASESNDDGVCAKCLGNTAIRPMLEGDELDAAIRRARLDTSLDLVAAKRVVLSAHLDTYGHAPGNEFDLDAAARAYARSDS